jgi:hypothetical protein
MNSNLLVVTFDTTGHTRLVKDGSTSEIMFASLKSGYFFRFAGLSIDEQMATQEREQRVALLNACARIQSGVPSDVIYPHNETVRRLVLAHFQNPALFDWKVVDVRGREYEREIGPRNRRSFL